MVGIDRFYSADRHDEHIAWRGALGIDTFVGDNFVLGVEGTFLNSRAEYIGEDWLVRRWHLIGPSAAPPPPPPPELERG